MSRKHALREALSRFDERRDRFLLKLDAAEQRLRCTLPQRQTLDLLFRRLDVSGHVAMSNLTHRRVAARILIRQALKLHRRHPQLTFYTGTFCWISGFAPEHAAEYDLPAMQRRVDKALRRVGLDAICAFDLDTINPTNDVPHRQLSVHVHALCFSRAPFQPRTQARLLNGSRSFSNPLGARPVVFIRLTPQPAHLARAAAYLLKQTSNAKRVTPRVPPATGNCLRPTDVKFTQGSALRMAEFWSHVAIADAVFGVGPGGKRLRAAWIKRFRRHLHAAAQRASAPNQLARDFDVPGFWSQLYVANPRLRFQPLAVVTRSGAYRASKRQ